MYSQMDMDVSYDGDNDVSMESYPPQYYLLVDHGRLVITNSQFRPDQPGLFVGDRHYLVRGTLIAIDPEVQFSQLNKDCGKVGGFAQCLPADTMVEGNCQVIYGLFEGYGIVLTQNLRAGEELLISSSASIPSAPIPSWF